MRPKDLKSNFTWATRAPLLKDKVLYVPEHYFQHEQFQMPSFEEIFEKPAHKVCVEYCSGNGDWVVAKAKENPDIYWVAVEKQFDRVRKIFSKRENHGVNNLLIVCGEALTFSRYYLSDSLVSEVFINFPDPWPKHRHAKHRLLKEEFIKELSRVLMQQGKLTCVTDDSVYCDSIKELLLGSTEWKPAHPAPYVLQDVPGYGYSFFEALWKAQGKTIFHIEFYNVSPRNLCQLSLTS